MTDIALPRQQPPWKLQSMDFLRPQLCVPENPAVCDFPHSTPWPAALAMDWLKIESFKIAKRSKLWQLRQRVSPKTSVAECLSTGWQCFGKLTCTWASAKTSNFGKKCVIFSHPLNHLDWKHAWIKKSSENNSKATVQKNAAKESATAKASHGHSFLQCSADSNDHQRAESGCDLNRDLNKAIPKGTGEGPKCLICNELPIKNRLKQTEFQPRSVNRAWCPKVSLHVTSLPVPRQPSGALLPFLHRWAIPSGWDHQHQMQTAGLNLNMWLVQLVHEDKLHAVFWFNLYIPLSYAVSFLF